MNYQKVYNDLINHAKDQVLTENYEIHHIIPKCMNGTDEESNLVKLSYRQHYIAHLLLWKIHKTNDLLYAFYMMNISSKFTKRDYANSRYFQLVKEQYKQAGPWNKDKKGYLKGTSVFKYEDGKTVRLSVDHEDVISGKAVGITKGRNSPTKGMKFSDETKQKMSKNHSGKRNHMYGKTHSEESKLKMSQSKKRLTDEDLKKRDQDRVNNLKYKQFQCPHCLKVRGPIMKRWHFDNCKDKK